MGKKRTKPLPSDVKVATAYLDGSSMAEACREGGYSLITSRKKADKIVARALELTGMGVKEQDLISLSRSRLYIMLSDDDTPDYIMSKIACSLVNGPATHNELHFHQHHPPQFWDMMKGKMKELLAAEGTVVDAESN